MWRVKITCIYIQLTHIVLCGRSRPLNDLSAELFQSVNLAAVGVDLMLNLLVTLPQTLFVCLWTETERMSVLCIATFISIIYTVTCIHIYVYCNLTFAEATSRP